MPEAWLHLERDRQEAMGALATRYAASVAEIRRGATAARRARIMAHTRVVVNSIATGETPAFCGSCFTRPVNHPRADGGAGLAAARPATVYAGGPLEVALAHSVFGGDAEVDGLTRLLRCSPRKVTTAARPRPAWIGFDGGAAAATQPYPGPREFPPASRMPPLALSPRERPRTALGPTEHQRLSAQAARHASLHAPAPSRPHSPRCGRPAGGLGIRDRTRPRTARGTEVVAGHRDPTAGPADWPCAPPSTACAEQDAASSSAVESVRMARKQLASRDGESFSPRPAALGPSRFGLQRCHQGGSTTTRTKDLALLRAARERSSPRCVPRASVERGPGPRGDHS